MVQQKYAASQKFDKSAKWADSAKIRYVQHMVTAKVSCQCSTIIITRSTVLIATCRYLNYSEADVEVLHPAGATRCTDGVKFGTEERGDQKSRAKFHPIGPTVRVYDPQNWNFYCDLTKMWNINAPQYPLRDFHKICRVCTSFQDALGVWFAQGVMELCWFEVEGSGCPQIFSAP